MNNLVLKWLTVGAGFGLGAVLAWALLLYRTNLYRNRPRPWNTSAIKVSFDQTVLIFDDWSVPSPDMGLNYALENTTTTDYTLTFPGNLLLLYKGTFEHNGNYRLDAPVSIPAGQRVMCMLRVPSDYHTDWSVDGFSIFDATTRYQIQFPKPTMPIPETVNTTAPPLTQPDKVIHEPKSK